MAERRPEHPFADEAPIYALGAMDADQRVAFEAHVRQCAPCAAALVDFAEVAVALAVAPVPPDIPLLDIWRLR